MENEETAKDILLLGLASGELRFRETISDISAEEYLWEPIPPAEQISDLLLPPERKKVWRVFQKEGIWTYDYTAEGLNPPPFTTIAWIMNHIAQTADMYLYCVKTGKPESAERSWEDLPVPYDFLGMCAYTFEILENVRQYLLGIQKGHITNELNKLTPAPWGEMRPTYTNIWGGVIEHVIQHAMQIAARKDRIRYGH